MTEPTFDVFWPEPVTAPDPALSADQRRTLRQREMVAKGLNPLRGSLHPFAVPETCSPEAPKGQPYTCGSCRFRVTIGYHNRSYPKCLAGSQTDPNAQLDDDPHISHGASTDVRAWWPACRLYNAGDQALSPDAARSIPEAS